MGEEVKVEDKDSNNSSDDMQYMVKLIKAISISHGTSSLGDDEGSIGQLTLSSGLKFLKATNTSISCKLIVPNFLSDDNGNWHVGAIATLIDNIGATAVFVFTAGHIKASLDFTISYFSTASIHEEVEIEAKIIGEYRGSLTYVLVEVKRASNGELIALGKQWMATGAKDEESDTAKRKRDSEELGDAMKALENRTLDSKREMDNLAALDEMKSMKLSDPHTEQSMGEEVKVEDEDSNSNSNSNMQNCWSEQTSK
ncbi:hypothetical protein ACFE04_008591 [Oxalis oulophora]